MQDFYVDCVKVIYVVFDLVRVRDTVVQNGGKEAQRIISFQPRRLISNDRIRRCVRLVECVRGKLRDLFKKFRRDLFRHTARHRAFDNNVAFFVLFAVDENVFVRRHFRGVLFAHCTAKFVGFPERVARNFPCDVHDLLLIHDTAVRNFQGVFKHRVQIMNVFGVEFAIDIVRDKLHRTRSIKRNASDNFFQTVGLKLHHELFHAFLFKLENRFRFAVGDEFINVRIVKRQLAEVRPFPRGFFHKVKRGFDIGKGVEPQKVHFQKPHRLDLLFVELSRDIFAAPLQRYEIPHGTRTNQNARRVHTRLSGHIFKAQRHIYYGFCGDVFFVIFDEIGRKHFRLFFVVLVRPATESLRQRNMYDVVYRLCPFVGVGVRNAVNARDVLNNRACGQRAVSYNLRDVVFAVLFLNVLDRALPVDRAEVDIEVWHRHPFRV